STSTASAEPMACPEASWRTPGASKIVTTASRDSVLESSLSEPPRSTMARSGRPACSIDAVRPVTMARTDTTTPTTPATPRTITRELQNRVGSVRRFMAVTAVVCLNMSASSQSVDEIETSHAEARQKRGHQREQDRVEEPHREDRHGQARHAHHVFLHGNGDHRAGEPERGRRQGDDKAFRDDERKHGLVGEPDGLQDRELRNALPNGLHHR